MIKEPRLRFTREEQTDPALEKPIRRAQKAAVRADKAQARIPKKKVRQTVIDPDTGKKTTKLTFEEQAKPPSKLSHAVRGAPANALLAGAHKEIRKSEQDNVGVEGAHKTEQAVEVSARLVREGYRSHKLKPYREAARAEQKLEKANINALYQKSLARTPSLPATPFPAGSKSRPSKRNMPPPNAPVKRLCIRHRPQAIPPRPRKRPARRQSLSKKKRNRRAALSCGTRRDS